MIITTHIARLSDGSGWSAEAANPLRGVNAHTYGRTRRQALANAISALLDKLEAAGDITQELEVVP